jgi:hypothetical protein
MGGIFFKLNRMGKFFVDEEGDLNNDDPREPEEDAAALALIEKLKTFLKNYYRPVRTPGEADFHYTTKEIYRQLQNIVPNELLYSELDVSKWLNEFGFVFYDFGNMRFEWLLNHQNS